MAAKKKKAASRAKKPPAKKTSCSFITAQIAVTAQGAVQGGTVYDVEIVGKSGRAKVGCVTARSTGDARRIAMGFVKRVLK